MSRNSHLPNASMIDFESVVREYGGRMLAVARRLLRNEQDACDAVQDAFLSAFKASHSFEGNSQMATWLHRIVVNACLMKLRSQRRRPIESIDPLLPTFDETGHHVREVRRWNDSPHDRLIHAELRQQVRDCIDQLPDTFRTIIILRDIEELDTREVAGLLEVSESLVKTRLHRARQALRTLLEPMFAATT